jgi:hypothetical protein
MQIIQALEDLPQDGGDIGLLQGAWFQLEEDNAPRQLQPPHPKPFSRSELYYLPVGGEHGLQKAGALLSFNF